MTAKERLIENQNSTDSNMKTYSVKWTIISVGEKYHNDMNVRATSKGQAEQIVSDIVGIKTVRATEI